MLDAQLVHTAVAAVVALGLPFLLFFLLAFGAFQILYLDRLAMRAGDPASQ